MDGRGTAGLLYLREEEIRLAMELLFYGYRDFTAGPDAILAELGMGRAHHRVLYFVGRHPGITVSELLAILRITKQSLGRVLKPLIAGGYVVQSPGRSDRRQRLLSLTPAGEALERRLFESQRALLARAFRDAGGPAVEGFRKVMLGLLGPEARARLGVQVAAGGTSPAGKVA
ncbi:MAG: MarR family transcriptional regulator [Acetobacteraceae bacterium]|nr:MarR family transcriptional regulator [Acetobacteraceae bacterium]